ncbi:MAG: hypothetical protein HY698_22730 [Deltaproteobacteria bacterium]|nr:hypothetical protein [Deltaproteobacteria bacterium]
MRSILLGACIALVACQRTTDQPGNHQGDPASLEEFLSEMRQATCGLAHSCAGTTMDACLKSTVDVPSQHAAQLVAAVNSQRIRYNDVVAGKILELVRAPGCLPLNRAEISALFKHVLIGALAKESSCWIDEECAHGMLCQGFRCDRSKGQCCQGKCTEVIVDIPVGQDCSEGACIDGASCARSPSGASSCVADIPPGEPCGEGVPGLCAMDTACQPSASDGGFSCQPKPNEGQPCGEVACARLDNYCDVESKTCKKRLPAGESCTSDEQCLKSARCKALKCTPLGGLDEPCDPESSDIQCLNDLKCDSFASQCKTPEAAKACTLM